MFNSSHFLLFRRLCLLIPLIAIWLMPAGPAAAAQVTLSWNANQESNLAGYRLYYGNQSRTYSNTIDVGNQTTYVLDGLLGGTKYYFAATAYNDQGAESGYSQELGWITPTSNHDLGITNLLPGDYWIWPLQIGETYYNDRNFRITAMPAELRGLTAIMPANSDKFEQGAEFLTFTLHYDADLYVAYDARATRLPAWLTDGFTDTGHIIETTDVTMTVWKKTVPAGFVALPGNHHGNPSGANSNYFVLVGPATGGSGGEAAPVPADPVPDTPLTISDVRPGAYQVTSLRTGDGHFIDRSFKITAMPAGFSGLTALRTANNEKWNSQAEFLSFTLNRGATIYVAYDARATRVPSWLSAGFANTGLSIHTTDVTMNLWQRTAPAGAVTLPGNYYGNPAGAESNYFVLLAPTPDNGGNAGDPGTTPLALSDVQPGAYQVASLRVGDSQFIDRSFKVTAMPADLAGLTAIKTANNDKWNNQARFISFTLNRNATIYVAYDARATRIPSWLSADYTNTGLAIQTTDVAMSLWQRKAPAGGVTLPGNYYGNPAGAESNYFVLVD